MKIKSFAVIVATCTILCHWDAFGCSEGYFMKEIKLTKGYVALVDDSDFGWLSRWNWHAHVVGKTAYARRTQKVDGVVYRVFMHRAIMGLTNREEFCDHINGAGFDNRRENLRVCTHSENQRNRSKNKNGSSCYKGVCWSKKRQKWMSQIDVNGITVRIGEHNTEIEAAISYNTKAKELYGDFCRINTV